VSQPLVFLMGNFAAEFPVDRQYAKNHMWGQPVGNAPRVGDTQQIGDVWRFGFSAYAVRLLQDVYFLDWIVDAGAQLAERQEIGQIESKKAESSLYAPIAGRLVRFNDELLTDPSGINVDKYGAGWLFEMAGPADSLLSPEAYLEHLTAVWEVTQRTIKGQMNE
jgi:glycine cleavage system H protein